MSEFKIITHVEGDDYGDDEVRYQEFFINGIKVGEGYYGGEPEDNSYHRDYGWVDEVIAGVARELGATVVNETKRDD